MGKGRKQFKGPQPRQPVKAEAQPGAAQKPNLGFFNAYTVTTREWKTLQVVLAGCGGTGTWMAMHIARLMHVLYLDNKGVNFTLIDPDTVEERNIGRQWFCEAEIGRPKAEAVAERLGRAFGLNTMVVVDEYHERFLYGADLTVLVGCTDWRGGGAGRRALNDTLRHNPEEVGPKSLPSVWWLDCGNDRAAGRVLLGTARERAQLRGAFVPKTKRCAALPGPALMFPGLLRPPQGDEEGDLSCAEMAARNLQSLNINASVAVQAAEMLTQLLVTRDLRRHWCAVNTQAGVVKSYYTTPGQVASDIGKPESFVTGPEAEEGIAA